MTPPRARECSAVKAAEAETSAVSTTGVPAFARWLVWAAGAALITMSVAIVTEALLRKLYAISLGGVNEITGYVFAVTTSWALSFALFERANVRIDAFYTAFSHRVRLYLELIGIVSMAVFFCYLAWRCGELVLESWAADRRSNSSLQFPVYLAQTLWWLGIALQVLSTLWILIRFLGLALSGQARRAIALTASMAEHEQVLADTKRNRDPAECAAKEAAE